MSDVKACGWVRELTEEDLARLSHLRTLGGCTRCGGHDWRKRAFDGRWLCRCYWTFYARPEEQSLWKQQAATYPDLDKT